MNNGPLGFGGFVTLSRVPSLGQAGREVKRSAIVGVKRSNALTLLQDRGMRDNEYVGSLVETRPEPTAFRAGLVRVDRHASHAKCPASLEASVVPSGNENACNSNQTAAEIRILLLAPSAAAVCRTPRYSVESLW